MTNLMMTTFLCMASFETPDDAGKIMASGRPFNPSAMTCAHRTLPLGTVLRVVDIYNHKAVVVTIMDRVNPRFQDRLDLSPAAFRRLDGLGAGILRVQVTVIGCARIHRPAAAPSLPDRR